MKNVLKVSVAIKWRLAAVMADREIDNQRLHELTGLHLGTISKLRNKKPSRLDTNTLDILCKALKCEPGDLLRFMPDEHDEKAGNPKHDPNSELKQGKKSTEGNLPPHRQHPRSFLVVVSEVPESA